MGKVRIYDLAKELKLESRKILEDARRMGVDVSVASNTLPDAVAAKIREMYFPKKEQAAAPRTARLIKHAPAPAAASTATAPAPEKAPAPVTTTAAPAPAPRPVVAPPPPPRETIVRTIAPPAARPAAPVAPPAPAALATEPIAEPPVVAAPPAPVPAAQPAPEAEIAARTSEVERQPERQPEPPAAPVEAPAPVPPSEVAVVAPPAPVPAAAPAPPAAPAPAAAPVVAPPVAAPARPAAPPATTSPSGTKVFQLPTPTRPMPVRPPAAPQPSLRSNRGEQRRDGGRTTESRPAQGGQTGRPGQGGQTGRLGQTGQPSRFARPGGQPGAPGARGGQTGQPGDVHLLPSGAQQRTVYIPPKDQRPKGRNQAKGHAPKDKFQEGNQRFGQRRGVGGTAVAPARQIPTELKPIRIVEGSTVREFAEKIDAKPRDIVTALMQRGVMATINQTLSLEIAQEIGREYGWQVTFGEFEDMLIESEFEITPEAMEDTDPRAPVITVMGHVDHGKTSLLDAIRSARVAEGEAGGITQHIGAYSVSVPNPEDPSDIRRVVFLDTPGHEAFTMMRARGAKVTDIVVLVVAADDGVMPQTVEAIEHAKAADVPIIVAINKIDKGDANPERVKKELAERGLLWDAWGGSTTMVEVSARQRQNINGLLEMILLTADILELKANPKRRATGTVLEAKLDRGRGAVATVLVQNGTLRIGEPLIVGNFYGKVRALMNDRGERVTEAGPATPVEILGLEGVPAAGDQFQEVDDVAKAQQISQQRQAKARTAALARTAARGLEQLAAQMETGEVKELLVILKADVQGSVEVLRDTLLKLSTDKVKVRIIRAGVGAITYDDVLLASASNATETGAATVIIGFNVRPETRADEVARQEGVDIRLHSIIYKVEEEIRNAMIGLMDATFRDVVLGKAEVRDIIRVPRVGSVAGCMVLSGSIKRTAQARLIRNNVVIFESTIGSLRRFKDDVSEVQTGYECGITVERFNDYKVGDQIEAYIVEKVAATHL